MIPPYQKLNRLVGSTWNNQYCSLYKDYWQSQGISDMPHIENQADWEQLPCISRATLNDSINPDSRLFINKTDIDVLGFTNGTSGKKPFFFWRHILPYPHGLLYFSTYAKFTEGPIMHFYPSHKAGGIAESARQAGLQTIAGNAHDLATSALLAKEAKVNALLVPPTLGLVFADYLDAQNLSADITFISLWGEYCSRETYQALQQRFPKAFFMFELGSSEAACHWLESTSACESPYKTMHTRDDTLVEIIDGEIVITTLCEPYAMPLIRYRMGDAGLFVDGACPCGKTARRIEILGRIDGDFVRIGGGEVRVEELDRVMHSILPYVEPTYTMKVGERVEDDQRIGTLTLEVTRRTNITMPEAAIELLIIKELTENMRLSPTMRLSSAIAKNLMASPRVRFVLPIDPQIKHKKIVRQFT